MSNVIVKENETLDSALRRFKRSCADYFGVTVDYLLGRTSYRYSLDTLNEEYAPGRTVAELVDIIQHFSPQNTASFLDYIELLQLRQKAEDCSSTS